MLITTIAIVFSAALMQSTFGFGAGLIAMPLLTLVLGLQMATPLFALLLATMSAIVVFSNWQQVSWPAVQQLIVASAIGIPCGVLLLQFAPAGLIIRALGLFLIGFSIYRLMQWQLPSLTSPYWAYACGFMAGVLGGAYNTNGPPIVLYGTAQQWPQQQFRATLLGYFLPSGVITVITHAVAGLWQADTLQLYLYCLPALLSAIAIGQILNRRLPQANFDTALSVIVGVLGGVLCWQGS